MTRPGVALPAIDYTRDRSHWVRLVADAHLAVAGDPSIDLGRLGDAAVRAVTLLNPFAGGPRGLECKAFAALAHAYARQSDAGRRAALAPLMIGAGGLVDQLLAETETAPAMRAAAPSPPAAIIGGARLPYPAD